MAQKWPQHMPALPVPAGEIQAVPGVVRILDHGVPWIRTRRELLEEWETLDETAARLYDGDRTWSQLTGSEQAVAGMWACARWNLGIDADTPITLKRRAVTGASIKKEISWSEMCVVSRLQGWESATGVMTWLLWITGAREDLLWPTNVTKVRPVHPTVS